MRARDGQGDTQTDGGEKENRAAAAVVVVKGKDTIIMLLSTNAMLSLDDRLMNYSTVMCRLFHSRFHYC